MKINEFVFSTIEVKPTVTFALIKAFSLLLLGVAFIYFTSLFMYGLIGLVIVFGAIYRFIYIRHICYTITPKAIHIKRGIFFKQIDTIALFRIKDYTLTKLSLSRGFTLTLRTSDDENPIIYLNGIAKPHLIKQIRERILEFEPYNRLYEIS